MRRGEVGPRRTPLERWLGLGPPTHRVTTRRGLSVPADDGTPLAATRLVPDGVERGPVVLIRTPYARDSPVWLNLLPRPIARRGLQVVVQSVRGTFGSGGTFTPGRNERADGLATVAWLRAQPWCDGRVAMAGGSYLATTQWAVGPYLAEPLEAMCVAIGSSTMLGGWYPQRALGLDQTLRWATLLATQEHRLGALSLLLRRRRIARALRQPDHRRADVDALGVRSAVYQEIVDHVEDPGHWADAVDHSPARGRLTTPTSMVTGWSDLFLRDQLADHQAQVAAGHKSRILIGPWSHSSTELLPHQARDAVEFLGHALCGRPLSRDSPVRIWVHGRDEWRDLPEWPPPTRPVELHLGADGAAAFTPPRTEPLAADPRRSIRYDPRDPTPAVGGPALNPPAGRQDQAVVERRHDVLLHTTDPLACDLEIVGTVTARLPVSTTDAGALVVVRLCDVDDDGVSLNVTEGLARLQPDDPDDPSPTEVTLDPTAHLFRRGHRIRVQVAAGAHPRVVEPQGGPYTVTVRYRPAAPCLVLPASTAGTKGRKRRHVAS